jgi:hypothetical protein
VPHYWEHVQWVWGKESFEEFMEFARRVTLQDSIDKITVPFLITIVPGLDGVSKCQN